jgi:hypothetical protein
VGEGRADEPLDGLNEGTVFACPCAVNWVLGGTAPHEDAAVAKRLQRNPVTTGQPRMLRKNPDES